MVATSSNDDGNDCDGDDAGGDKGGNCEYAGDDDAAASSQYVVSRIIGRSHVMSRSGGGGVTAVEEEYLVQWEGYEEEEATWEPAGSFSSREALGCLIKEYVKGWTKALRPGECE